MITVKNDKLEILISEHGAELRRVILEGKDAFWEPDPKFWDGVAPVLFPICGSLRDNKFIFEGKEYTMGQHGFARNSDFTVEKTGDDFATFLLTENAETLKQYPWRFELRITYKLIDKSIKIDYDVKNLSKNTMYFSIGSHESYACPEGIEDYDIIFPQKETLESHVVKGGLIDYKTVPILKDSKVLSIQNKHFEADSLVFKDLKSRSVTLKNRKNGREIMIDFPNADYLVIWTVPPAGYLCIEPWCGIPPMVDAGYEIEKKEGIISLESGKTDHREHIIHL